MDENKTAVRLAELTFTLLARCQEKEAWLAEELAERLEWSVERVRRKMIQLENYGLVKHVREGRYNWYFSTKDYLRYLEENPEQDITDKLKK